MSDDFCHRIYGGVGQGTEIWVNPVVDAPTMWEGKVRNQPPFPCVVALGYYPKTIEMQWGKGERVSEKGPSIQPNESSFLMYVEMTCG